MFLKDLLGFHKVTIKLPVELRTAATVDEFAAFRAPFDLEVTAVRFVPSSALSGVTSTEMTLSVINKDQDGLGTDSMALLSFVTGVDAVAFDEKTIPLSATVADRDASEGDIISIAKTVTSTGLGLDGSVEIEFVSRGPT